MNGEKILKKGRKGYKFIIWIMILIFCVCVGTFFIRKEKEKMLAPTFEHLSVSEGMGDPGKFASLDVEFMTEEIVIYGNENSLFNNFEKYHIIICEDNMYIANIAPELMEDLQPIIDATYETEEFVKVKSKRIFGVTQTPTEEFKELAVEAYNKIFPTSEEDKMTIEDYDFTFGEVILNTRVDFVDTTIEDTIIIVGLLIEIFLIIILFVLTSNIRNSNKYLRKNGYEKELIAELNDVKNCDVFKNEKIFITENFLVDNQSGLTVVRFSDVKWVYEVPIKTFGITTSSSVMFRLKDGKTKIHTLEFEGNANPEFVKIVKIIERKVSKDCLKGYSKENKKAYKNKPQS